jgi:hypothetical protein
MGFPLNLNFAVAGKEGRHGNMEPSIKRWEENMAVVFSREGEMAREGNADIGVETGSPHVYEVFAEFVNSSSSRGVTHLFLVVLARMGIGRIE